MKGNKKNLLFILFTFFIFGVSKVNATEVIVKDLGHFNDLMSNSNGVDVIKLNSDITLTSETYWSITNDITLDLNGFSINSSSEKAFRLLYYGDYTVKIINSSNSKSSSINHTYTGDYGNTFFLYSAITGKNKTLLLDSVNLNESGAKQRTILCEDRSSTDTLIVKNLNAKSFEFSMGFDNYKFSNVILKPVANNLSVSLALGNSTLTVKDILGDDQEVYYQKFDESGLNMIGEGIADENLLAKDLWTKNLNDSQDNSITVRYKNGFTVDNIEINENFGYSNIEKNITITNRGTSPLQIENVSVSSPNFEIKAGDKTNLNSKEVDTSWVVKVKDGLSKGEYTATITVTDTLGNSYIGTITFKVNAKELSGLSISGVDDTITYNSDYTPVLSSEVLTSDDYNVIYYQKIDGVYKKINSKPLGVGEYKVEIIVTNENYKVDTIAKEYKIVPKKINPTVNDISAVRYTGEDLTPEISVYNDKELLKEDEDYTLEYKNNKDVGTATIIIKPVEGNNYTFDEKEVTFEVLPKSIKSESISVSLNQSSFKYTGNKIEPVVTIKDGEKTLTKDVDYKVSFDNNINIGENTGIITIIGKGNYYENTTKNFSITPKEVQEIIFENGNLTKTYGDGSFPRAVTHSKGNGTIKYTSSDESVAEVNEENGMVTIKGAGTTIIKATASETADYDESFATYTLTVNKKKISFTAYVHSKDYDQNDNAEVNYILFSGLVGIDSLTENVDYTIVSSKFENTNVGYSKPAFVKISLTSSSVAKNYDLEYDTYQTRADIKHKTILSNWVSYEDITYTYNGSDITPVVTVKDPSSETVLTLTKDTHYTVEYTNNKDAGIGKIKVTGIGNYSGEIEKEFTINKKLITPEIMNIPNVVFNGSEHTPDLVVKYGDITLAKNDDYTVEYTSNLRAGNNAYAEITEVASSNYTFATIGKEFTIDKYEIKSSDVTLEYTKTVFDNNAKKPSVTVKMGSEVIAPSEYTVDYLNNTNVGTATVKVTIKPDSIDFTGEVTKNFEIVNKTLLSISGITNQQVTYTGNPVNLIGNLQVSNNINVSDLTVKWYNDGAEIERPTNVGNYKVVYSYEDENYIGSLTVEFKITKKTSVLPSVNSYKGVVGDKLSSITLPEGFKWVDSNEIITAGENEYRALYTTNNDEINYTTENALIKVYGKSKVNLITSVHGLGGTISPSKNNILEGTTETITFTPNTGFEISKVEVNGVDKTSSVTNNKLDLVIGNSDVSVVVTYKVIEYTIIINDVENAIIDPSGIIKVDYNSNKEFTIKAEQGYKLVSVKVNGVERISDINDDILTLENILADAEVVIIVQKNVYEVVEGANQKYTITKDNEARFKIDADYTKFENGGKVYVDDVLVDPSNYTSESGSTIITLKKEFANQLSVGEHTLKVEFTDGESTTMFTIAKITTEENPKTGDNIGFYILTGIISTLGLAGTGIYIYRRKQTN